MIIMKKENKKRIWIIIMIFVLFGSTLGFVFLSRFTPRQTTKITESLIVNATLDESTEANIISKGFTIIKVESNQSYFDELKKIQEEFKTTGGYKQILVENLNGEKFHLVATSSRNLTELNKPDFDKLREELCNIVWDPPLNYCFSP